MPYLMSTHFDEFLQRISVSGDPLGTANTRKNAISDLLGKQLNILNIFASGSLVRGTALKGVSDVDIFVELHYGDHLEGRRPKEVLQLVRDTLAGYNAQIVKKNGQAVTLYFKSWPNVDVVPAKRVTSGSSYYLQIPDANEDTWITTDPAAHDQAMSRLPARGRQLIRMVKCWNDAHSGYLRSFHIEQIVLGASYLVHDQSWDEDQWPWVLKRFFELALEATEPAAPISRSYETDPWLELRDRLKRARELAYAAWLKATGEEIEEAVERLRILFGDRFPAYG